MIGDDNAAWLLASQALDHHDTVAALTAALPAQIAYADDPGAQEHLAEHLAQELARAGLVLSPLAVPTEEQVEQIGAAMRERAATGWFGREGD